MDLVENVTLRLGEDEAPLALVWVIAFFFFETLALWVAVSP